LRNRGFLKELDWVTVLLYLVLVLAGWLNIYSSIYSGTQVNMFDPSNPAGRQFVFMCASLGLAVLLLLLDAKFYQRAAPYVYVLALGGLLLTLLVGEERNGAKAWINLGPISLQLSEFAKAGTALMLARYLAEVPAAKFHSLKNLAALVVLLGLPAGFILLQPDVGTLLVFGAFILVLYREGLDARLVTVGLVAAVLFLLTIPFANWHVALAVTGLGVAVVAWAWRRGWRLIAQIALVTGVAVGFVFSTSFVFNQVLAPHQQARLKVLFDPGYDTQGVGYNVAQSKIAIGSGGVTGKGWLKGSVTNLDYVPEQSTDFIFCTLGEEQGWLGTTLLIGLFTFLFLRLLALAERQKTDFARIFGYSVAGILFMHFAINIGMTIGLFPVVGIPLPFFSYGGSSLLGFSLLLFIFLKLDAQRSQVLKRSKNRGGVSW